MIRSISRTPTVVVLLLLLLSCTRTRLYFNDNKIYTYHYAVYACATASSSRAVVLYTRYIRYIVSDLGHPRPSLDHIYIYIYYVTYAYTRDTYARTSRSSRTLHPAKVALARRRLSRPFRCIYNIVSYNNDGDRVISPLPPPPPPPEGNQ